MFNIIAFWYLIIGMYVVFDMKGDTTTSAVDTIFVR